MKKLLHTLSLLLFGAGLSAGVSSCSRSYEDVDGATKKGFYDTQRQIYFNLLSENSTIEGYRYGDGTYTTFGQAVNAGELTADSTQIRVDVPVRMTGLGASTPLEFSVTVGQPIDYTTIYSNPADRPQPAVSGTDYQALQATYSIAPGQFSTTIPVYFDRAAIAAVGAAGKELILELRPNSNFGTQFTAADAYRIRVQDYLSEPIWWTNFYGPQGILGTYSQQKHRLILAEFEADFWTELAQGDNMYNPLYYTRIAAAAVRLRALYPDLGFGANAERFLP